MRRAALDIASTTISRRPLAPHEQAIRLLQQHSLSALVEQELKRKIISGELAAGVRLTEAEVAERLGVSRGPVREAFRALEQAGLIVNEKNRGVCVRQISLQEADQIFEVRAALDGMIGRLSAERITSAELTKLRSVIKKMKSPAVRSDPSAYFLLNLEFHDVLAQATRNPSLIEAYRRAVNELNLFRQETLLRNTENIRISTADHENIVNAIAERNPAKAQQLLFDHVMTSRLRLHEARIGSAGPTAGTAKEKLHHNSD